MGLFRLVNLAKINYKPLILAKFRTRKVTRMFPQKSSSKHGPLFFRQDGWVVVTKAADADCGGAVVKGEGPRL